MTSLRELKALYDLENMPSPNVANLTKRVELQRRALAQAESDLQVALGRDGSPRDLPDLPQQPQPGGPRLSAQQVTDTAAAIVRAGQVRRGEVAPDMPPVITTGEAPKTPAGTAALAEAILAAGRKARAEKN